MDLYTLPATTYVPPPRLARKHVLNTIIEDDGSENEEGNCSDEEKEEAGRGRARHLLAPRSIASTSPVPSLTSSLSSYQRSNRRSQDFDDLYDVSDDDSIPDNDLTPSIRYQDMSTRSTSPNESICSAKSRNRYPSLIIPSPGCWPTIEKLKNGSPPLPAKVPLSPAVLSLLPQDIPSISQAPSLISSLVSNQQAASTAPATPDSQHPDVDEPWGQVEMKTKAGRRTTIFEDFELSKFEHLNEVAGGWSQDAGIGFRCNTAVRDFACEPEHSLPESPILGTEDGYPEEGVQLPAEALKTLQHLSLEIPFRPDISSEEEEVKEEEMKEVQGRRSRRSSFDWTPASQQSEYSIAQLSIPSPGGFFSSLGGNARHTWCVSDSRPPSVAPPSSTTAEQFYSCPWNQDASATVERVVEIPETDTDGPPTARQGPLLPVKETVEPTVNETTVDYDEDYEKTIQEVAERSLDRTSVWLATQTSYMAALRETNPVNDLAIDVLQDEKRVSRHLRDNSLGSPMRKAVRFLEQEAADCETAVPATTEQSDPIYYHAFQHIANATTSKDAFRHQRTRADSLQASRSCLPHEHIEQLSGNYHLKKADRPVPLRPISMMPGKGADAVEETSEQRVIARVERERQALEQISCSVWAVEAARYLHGGNLLNYPGVDALLKGGDSARVLDLGGQPNCGWAWHCCRAYRNAKVYTATTEQELVDSSLRGPSNHRRTAVTNLWELPYPDNYFTVISARSLFQYLKQEKPLGQGLDQYDLCLQECLRCLKPGGYLEFFVMDSEVVNAGTLGTAASVEFGFNLKTRGYDPAPTKNWLGRVRRSGFDDIKRAWTFLPMGTLQRESSSLPETPPPDVSTHSDNLLEAVHGPVGSTADAASITGLVGGWAWEQWMLKLQVEMGKEHLLEGMAGVMEEGKLTGAGWRCLNGWARKPSQP
ncbi:MAG: hypothetical protein L6R40_005407 [Gallowayella cf. fulva]|nr:MAG: hypothetical protein L6R40_005407 [Xanthomendoza cf. fulva]